MIARGSRVRLRSNGWEGRVVKVEIPNWVMALDPGHAFVIWDKYPNEPDGPYDLPDLEEL